MLQRLKIYYTILLRLIHLLFKLFLEYFHRLKLKLKSLLNHDKDFIYLMFQNVYLILFSHHQLIKMHFSIKIKLLWPFLNQLWNQSILVILQRILSILKLKFNFFIFSLILCSTQSFLNSFILILFVSYLLIYYIKFFLFKW